MNVHDSERMAGLLEAAGYEPASDAGGRRRHRAEHLHGPREGGGQGVQPRSANSAPPRPRTAVRPGDGRGGLPGAAGRRGDLQARRGRSTSSSGTQAEKRLLPMLVDEAMRTGTRQIDINPYDDVSFPLGIVRAVGPGQGLRHHHRGLQRLLRVLRRPADTRGHERMRPKAEILAEVRGGRRPGAGPRSTCSARSSTTTRRPTTPGCDFAGLLEAVDGVPGVAPNPVREPPPAARHGPPDRRDAGPAARLQAPAPAGPVGLDAGPGGHAKTPHAGGLPRPGAGAAGSRCRASSCRPT